MLIKETRFQNNVVKRKLELYGRHFAKKDQMASLIFCILFLMHITIYNTLKKMRQIYMHAKEDEISRMKDISVKL